MNRFYCLLPLEKLASISFPLLVGVDSCALVPKNPVTHAERVDAVCGAPLPVSVGLRVKPSALETETWPLNSCDNCSSTEWP